MARKVIFDTDPGVDDAAALLFLSRRVDIELLGVTTVFGNAGIEAVTRNALHLKALFGIEAPVARGAGRALTRVSPPPPAHIHGGNGLGDAALDGAALPALDPRPAHMFIADTVREHPGEVTVIAVGRMTNLALALAHDPELAGLVGEVVIMGGAFGFSGPNGNVTPVAEANIIGDPDAADQVFGAPWTLTAIGLDVTRQVRFSLADIDRLAGDGDEASAFIAAITRPYARYHERFGLVGCYVHDSSAAAFAVAPHLFTLRRGPIRVVTDGLAEGQTIQRDPETPYPPGAWDDRPHHAAAAGVDAEVVRALILDTISAPDALATAPAAQLRAGP